MKILKYFASVLSMFAVSALPVLAQTEQVNLNNGRGYGMWGMMSSGMYQMMGTGSWGVFGFFGWLWMLLWTVISVLILVLLWTLIKKNSSGKK